MTKEEGLIKILREMDKKRVEELDKNTKKVFDAVMKIADERDRLLEENRKLKEKLETSEKTRKEALNLIKSKEYVIDMFTFGYEIDNYDIFKLKNILNIEKSDK